jgi:hypothetical protein
VWQLLRQLLLLLCYAVVLPAVVVRRQELCIEVSLPLP